MYALVLIGIFFVYLLISIAVVSWVARQAKAAGGSPGFWGASAALLMYLLVFWDHVPTIVAHNYYCTKEAGFWAYKTPEKWMKENPGVIENLVENNSSPEGLAPDWPTEHRGNMSIANINARFGMAYINHFSSLEEKELLLNIWRWRTELIDQRTGEVIARQVDFSAGDGRIGGEMKWRFWLQRPSCANGSADAMEFSEFLKPFKGEKK